MFFLLAIVSEFNCFLRSRCSMEMWCPDDIGRDSWNWVGPPAWGRACFNYPEWGGSSSPVKTEPHQIVLLLLVYLLGSMELGVSAIDPRPVQMILWSTTYLQGGAQEKQSGFLGRRGRAGRQAAATLLTRSSSSSPWTGEWVQQRFVEQNHEAPCISCAAWSDAFLQRDEAHEVPWKHGHYFCEPFDRPDTCPRVHTSVNGCFWTNFLRLYVKEDPDLEVVSPSALGNLDTSFTRTLYLTVLALRQSTEVWKNFTIFSVNVNSDPEVHDFIKLLQVVGMVKGLVSQPLAAFLRLLLTELSPGFQGSF